MKKSIIIISSLLIVAFVSGNVFARGQGKGQGMAQGYNQDCSRYEGQGAFNDLSKEQRTALNELRQRFIDETYELRAAKFAKQQGMRMLMQTSDPDRAKLGTLSQEITDQQKQIRDKRIDFRLAAKKIAPELGMGKGFGQGRGNESGRGGQGMGQGYNQDCPRYGGQGYGRGWHHNN
ncbi:MAG: periplasmic heavy metal sensor [Desulfobacula sp.]|jgi:zinc resistance-associated protein|uniref:Spy/CpxP family protein refolding chaperone n=1 Tax=Desulfobacula sp. TaxID=2593537 RepID=UPI001DEB77DA|nr:periplasmic heavy metal sensor [Desulfobacula sp.]MBT3487805.1 periplasmic heavy metal sensor [Desulfobacula sp.]MBT3807425.1 periplasmic heavy metal sensor [Desulfobacula sp.]MBT4027560.1 periplasmic heavy metal sensor [Desulfobacula sp.]MBT4199533.1 periplasmic heavy metal sensor [Desulfobacula sp.]